MIRSFVAGVTLFASVGFATADKVTITPVSSLKPVPVGSVARSSTNPVDGVSVAPPREVRPVFSPENMRPSGRAPTRVPLPEFNLLSVSFCEMDLD